ncbi:hypothetical protein ACFQI7_05855 [Paenibacillus allorhizosphaerae]|uniref:Permease n=1 Tax=Paenibacillus allorhizosphaerae TaxID=2849866 RepID=A0ABM8VBG1_9BACL|nr:hypothetical protein [Paenibacillus allorhizosphaerae]CAG7620268.1 hypothetical protein PAECIP111802_00655 [Paenibacillus allorhizosphaerae]
MNDNKEDRIQRNSLDARSQERFKKDQIAKESGGSGYEEEYAAEIAPAAAYRPETRQFSDNVEETNADTGPAEGAQSFRWLGYTALLLSIASLFIYPALLGTTSALFGFFAYILGFRALGAWSVAIGLISLAGYLFLVPLYA